MSSKLTQDVVCYQKTGEGEKDLIDRISLYAYQYPKRASDWDEDRCSEFFLAFYPRISRLLERYRPEYTFETYLCSCLKWFMKTFNENMASRDHYEAWWTNPVRADYDDCGSLYDEASDIDTACENREADEECCCEGPFTRNQDGQIADPAVRRRLLFIAMLRAADLDSDQLESIARLTGTDPDWLFDRVGKAKETILWKIENRERLRRRRNECWYRMDGASKRLKAEEACEGNHYREWQRKEQTWRKRYHSASEGLKHSRVSPSHKDIGNLLNVPPGTVSSGLHLIRKAWARVESSL